MTDFVSTLLPWTVLASHILLVLVFLAVLNRKGWGGEIVSWVNRNALILGFLTSMVAIVGSLFYSNVVGFAPCNLCWWQRIFIYPQAVLFLTALKYKDFGVFKYSSRLAVIASVISIYHLFVQMGGNSILPCSASASCDKLYVYFAHYITIPTMALTISATFLLLAWIRKGND